MLREFALVRDEQAPSITSFKKSALVKDVTRYQSKGSLRLTPLDGARIWSPLGPRLSAHDRARGSRLISGGQLSPDFDVARWAIDKFGL